MHIITDIVELFSSRPECLSVNEDFEVFEQKFKLGDIRVPDETKLKQCLDCVIASDSVTIYINIDSSEDDIAYSLDGDFSKFRSTLQVAMGGLEEDTEISLKIIIRKKVDKSQLSIYSRKEIYNYFSGFSIAGLMDFFSEIVGKHGTLVFLSIEQIAPTVSSTFGFVSGRESIIPPFTHDNVARTARLRQIRLSTHAILLSGKELIPNDFEFNPEIGSSLQTIFDRLSFTMIVAALFDLTSLVENTVAFRLNGYKGIDGSVDVSTIPIDNYIEEYRNIYNWVYEAGNVNDKLGLARNIISLHLNPANDFSYNGNMFSSILSAYKVYEKQNIKQYIEIRNKLSDQLIDYNKRANSIVEGFASTFQKSALSVLTLFSSIIALKVLGNTKMSGNFVIYSTILSLVILTISFIYMMISRLDTFFQRRRYVSSYENFKLRYTDLLNVDDIKKILNDDKEFNEDIIFINRKIKIYTIWWALVLFSIFLLVMFFFINEKWSEITAVMENYPNV